MTGSRTRFVFSGLIVIAALAASEVAFAGAGSGGASLGASAAEPSARQIRVRVQPQIVEYGPSRVSVAGITAASISVRVLGADDPAGRAYQWTPYHWRRLRLVAAHWRGVLPAPPLRGIYQLQIKVQQSKRLLQSPHWLLRVLPVGTLKRRAFVTPGAVIRDYVSHLPGNPVLVAVRPCPQAAYDHRDPRMQRIYVIAYAPRGNTQPSSRLGLFVTTIRNGYKGRWRLLEATTSPPD